MVSPLTTALNKILKWTEENNPKYLKYLQPGLTKEEIDLYENGLLFKKMLTIAECYERGIYDNKSGEKYDYNLAVSIWRKYNSNLKKFASRLVRSRR